MGERVKNIEPGNRPQIDLIDSLGQRYGRHRVLVPMFLAGVGIAGLGSIESLDTAAKIACFTSSLVLIHRSLGEIGFRLATGNWISSNS